MRKAFETSLVAAVLALGLLSAAPAFAQGGLGGQPTSTDGRIPIITEVPLPAQPELTPGSTPERVADYLLAGRIEDVAQYIGIVYNFLIGIVGMVAAVAMVIGGFQYLTSAGDSGKIGAAKSRMANAFIGLVLALGAYTILNTINPRLLSLKLPDLKNVGTELSFLPWCEDIMKGDPLRQIAAAPVTPMSGVSGCGGMGKFMRGNSEQICAFYGDCRIGKGHNNALVTTCLQQPGLSLSEVQEELKKDANKVFAHCLPCAYITTKAAGELGFPNLESACDSWEAQVNGLRAIEDPTNQALWSYCGKTSSYPSCLQADINCRAANDNEDTGSGQCGDNDHDCGCEGYDDHPTPYFSIKDAGIYEPGTVRNGDTLDNYQDHLANVCLANPCVNYTDDRHATNPQAFKRGCKGDRGLVSTGIRVVRKGDFSFADCRPQ